MRDRHYLRFDLVGTSDSGLTKIWNVQPIAGNAELGKVKWYAPWRTYCYFPNPFTIYDTNCLFEIAEFCGLEKKNHGA